jgi:DNA-directed RNA polymerase subunit E'
MFYTVDINDYVRVEPRLFGLDTQIAIEQQLAITYSDYHDEEIGEVIAVLAVANIGEGTIIPGDGAAYYNADFKLLIWKPEMQELVYGTIDEITNFGAFINLGVMKGMIHISQTMEDYVTASGTTSLSGRSTKKVLKKGDKCLARIVAVSYKGDSPKIGLTMRQPGLGKIEWIEEEKKKAKSTAKKLAQSQEKAAKGAKGKK